MIPSRSKAAAALPERNKARLPLIDL